MYTVVYSCKDGCWYITTKVRLCDFAYELPTNEWLELHPIMTIFDSEQHDSSIKAKCSAEALTLEYMAVYGTDKVRGGSYTDIKIDYARLAPALLYVKSTLQEEKHEDDSFIDVSSELFCRRCGYIGHLVESCVAEVGLDGCLLEDDADSN